MMCKLIVLFGVFAIVLAEEGNKVEEKCLQKYDLTQEDVKSDDSNKQQEIASYFGCLINSCVASPEQKDCHIEELEKTKDPEQTKECLKKSADPADDFKTAFTVYSNKCLKDMEE